MQEMRHAIISEDTDGYRFTGVSPVDVGVVVARKWGNPSPPLAVETIIVSTRL
jgi:hypothetical protein